MEPEAFFGVGGSKCLGLDWLKEQAECAYYCVDVVII
jgi:hypothetical protein